MCKSVLYQLYSNLNKQAKFNYNTVKHATKLMFSIEMYVVVEYLAVGSK